MNYKILLLSLVITSSLYAQKGNRKGHDNMAPVVPEELIPPSPLLSPEEALKSFEVADGFVIEAFATEPMIDRPVALDYDSAGRLWVCEMRGYMLDLDATDEDVPIGRIVVLEDTDSDGKADKRTVFLEEILLPRAIAVYPDGILFADQKQLRFIKRDGVKPVGEAKVAVEGFIDKGNVEHLANGLVRNIDNWIYNAKSSMRIRRDGENWISESTPFRGQWGVAFDNYGRIYHNHNSQFLFGEFFAPNLLEGNDSVNIKVSSSSGLGPNKPFPIRVTPGINRAYMQKSNGYKGNTLDPETFKLRSCSAAAGMAVYRGTNYPENWVGHGLVTESAVAVVRAIEVEEKGTSLRGKNVYDEKDWIASTDERFRPVNIYNSPDGATHLVDFHHGIIQHRTYMTSYLRKQYESRGLDKPGVGHGRIYRVRHTGGNLEKIVDLETISSAELVKLLSHKNGWHRDMAQRLLLSREPDADSLDLLVKLVGLNEYPLGQIHAVWTLEGLGKLTASEISTALSATDPKVVTSALWAANSLVKPELLKLENDLLTLKPVNAEMKVYLTRALGPLGTEAAFKKINALLGPGKNKFINAAAFSGLANNENAFVKAVGPKLRSEQLKKWLVKATEEKKADTGPALVGEELASFNRGKELYHGAAACFACHSPDGSGITNLGPPLDNSEWVNDSEEVFAKILLHGISGPIEVAGEIYKTAAEMPALSGNPMFTDEKIADIITYTRNEWSNKGTAVSADLIKKLRAETVDQIGRPYTPQDLK